MKNQRNREINSGAENTSKNDRDLPGVGCREREWLKIGGSGHEEGERNEGEKKEGKSKMNGVQ